MSLTITHNLAETFRLRDKLNTKPLKIIVNIADTSNTYKHLTPPSVRNSQQLQRRITVHKTQPTPQHRLTADTHGVLTKPTSYIAAGPQGKQHTTHMHTCHAR
jgi:hypothetical protein